MMNDDDDDFKIFNNNKAQHLGKLQEPKKPRPPYADPVTTGFFIKTPSMFFFVITFFFFLRPRPSKTIINQNIIIDMKKYDDDDVVNFI